MASIDHRRWGPDCQRRASCVGSPPSPRILTAKPSLTWGLRLDGPPGPRLPAPVVVLLRRRLFVLAGGRVRLGRGRLLRGGGVVGAGRLVSAGLGRRPAAGAPRRAAAGRRLVLDGRDRGRGRCGRLVVTRLRRGGLAARGRRAGGLRAGLRRERGGLVDRREGLDPLAGAGVASRGDDVLDLLLLRAGAGRGRLGGGGELGLGLLLALRLALAGLGQRAGRLV